MISLLDCRLKPDMFTSFWVNALCREPPPGWPTGQKADVQEADHVDSESPTNV